MVYFKNRQFQTYRKAIESDYTIIDSLSGGASSMTVEYAGGWLDDLGSWLIFRGELYLITKVKPDDAKRKTELELRPPQAIFDRDIYYTTAEYGALGTGAFLANVINNEFVHQSDMFYAVPMTVTSAVTLAHIPPCDDGEVFNLLDYINTLRESNNIVVEMTFSGNRLYASISEFVPETHNVTLTDGHAVLKSQNFGSGDSIAKVTTIQGGVKTNWYADAAGNVSTTPPVPRIRGRWEIVKVGDNDDPAQKAREAFKGGKAGAFNVQFASDRDYSVGDIINLRTDGKLVCGQITAKTTVCNERWTLYKTGDLAVTLTDKINRMVGK